MKRHISGTLVAITALLFASRAPAAPKDAAARKLDRKAIEGDYLAMRFSESEKKLKRALAICGGSGCSKKVLAQIHRDLGIVYVEAKRVDEAKGQFVQAIHVDPATAIPKDLSTPEIETTFAAATEQARTEKPTAEATEAPAEDAPAGATGGDNGGAAYMEACGMDSDCASNVCKNGRCSEADRPSRAGKSCETNLDCGNDEICHAKICESTAKKNWFQLAWEEDIAFLPAAKDACLSQTVYSCFQGNGQYFQPDQAQALAGVDDQVKAGIGAATTRVRFGYDRRFGDNFALGGRLGYAYAGGGPDAHSNGASFVPIDIEARATVFFGSQPFVKKGFRPYLLASGGFAQYDVGTTVAPGLIAWKRYGLWFASAGLGLVYALTRGVGFFAEARALRTFPTPGTVVPFQVGFMVGL